MAKTKKRANVRAGKAPGAASAMKAGQEAEGAFVFSTATITMLAASAGLLLAAFIFSLSESRYAFWALGASVAVLLACLIAGERNFLRKSMKTFRYSFTHLRLNLVLIILCDVLLILLVAGTIFYAGSFLTNKSEAVAESIDLESIVRGEDIAAGEIAIGSLSSLFWLMAAVFAAVLLISIVLYSVFKGIIWELSYSRAPAVRKLACFMRLNLLWLPMLAVLAGLISLVAQPQYAARLLIIFIAVALHATIVLNGVFVHVEGLWKAIGTALRIAFLKARYFLLPYLAIALVMSFMLRILTAALFFLGARAQAAVMMALFVPLMLAAGRIWLAQVIRDNLE